MKRKIINTTKALMLLFATLLISNSCSDLLNNPMQDKETGEDLQLLLLDLNFFDTKIYIEFLNAETGEEINQDELIVTLAGKDVDKIVDAEGKKKTTYKVKDGFIELAVDPNYTPTEEEPIEFVIIAETEEYKWYCIPTEVSLIQKGYNDVTVQMLYEGEEDLKSAFSTSTLPPFNMAVTSNKPDYTYELSSPQYEAGRKVFLFHRPTKKNQGATDVSINISDFTDDANTTAFGYYGYYSKDGKLEYIDELTLSGNYTGISNYKFFAATRKAAIRSTLTVVFNSEKEASAKFGYSIRYSDGSNKTGYITADSKSRTAGVGSGIPGLTSRLTNTFFGYSGIAPIYIPIEDQNFSLTLFQDAQYNLKPSTFEITTADALQVPFSWYAVSTTMTPISNLNTYQLIAKVGCEGASGLGAAPTLSGKFWEKSTPDKKTAFLFSEGVATLQLKPNTDYGFKGSYNGTTAEFDFTTDPSHIENVKRGVLSQFPELASVRMIIGTEANGVTPINVDVIYKSEHCPF